MRITPGAVSRVSPLDLLRVVYTADLMAGRADAAALGRILGASASSVRLALEEASAKGLVKLGRGSVALTPAGRQKLKIVMLGGAFEIIHPGHIQALSEAKTLGNTLVVVVATDESVTRNKGRPPATDQASRVALVSSLRQVDLAIPGNKGSIFQILVRVRPDVVALGYDQRHNAEEIVKEAAKRGVVMSTARLGSSVPDVKTSKILQTL